MMTKPSLSKLLARKKDLTELLQKAATGPWGEWYLEDAKQRPVFGQLSITTVAECPVRQDGEVIGWVKGDPATTELIAALLENWLRQESEKKQLGAETLHLYREINLIFSFSEKLAALLQPANIAQLTLQEAGQIVRFEAGGVFLLAEKTGNITLLAGSNNHFSHAVQDAFLQKVIQSGQSAILNLPGEDDKMLLHVAMKIGPQPLGSIVLIGQTFSAADLKLLATLAFQTAVALDNAFRHELSTAKALREQREKLTLELAMKSPFFKKIMAIMETKYTDPDFSVAALSGAMHLSVSQLQRKIGAVTDLTPGQIIRDLRLTRAKELLQTTDLNVSEVAFQAGFNDPSYFTRLFTRELHCTPSEWKENARE